MSALSTHHPNRDCSSELPKAHWGDRLFLAVIAVNIVVASLAVRAGAVEVGAPPVGRSIASFSLQDYRGKTWSLADFRDKKAVALVFVGVECPLVQHYAARLQ